MNIKTIILPLDKSGIANPVEARLVNSYLAILRDKGYYSSNHVIIAGSKPNIVVGSDGKIYANQDCKFESFIMAQVVN